MSFKIGDLVLYSSHGIGKITDIINETISGIIINMYKISFEKKQLTISIPITSAISSGLRKLSSTEIVNNVLTTLNENTQKRKKIVWGKCSSKYELKINSGDIYQIAEIVYDLHSYIINENCCYSERVIYENAINILIDEIAYVLEINTEEAKFKILEALNHEKEII